jgi:excisionase family DNA binding protein
MATDKREKPETDKARAKKRMLTYPQYAAENQISVDTVRRMVARGELKVERFGRKCVRILAAAT